MLFVGKMKGSSVLFLGMLVCGAVSMKEDTKHGNPIHNAHYAEDGEHDEKYDHAAVLGKHGDIVIHRDNIVIHRNIIICIT